MRIFVTGGTGLIGRKLLPRLVEANHEVFLLSRHEGPVSESWTTITGDPAVADESWLKRVDECDAVIHLAGEPVFAHRWSKKFKQKLWDSRVLSTQILANRLREKRRSNRIFLSGSAIGYYGSRGDEELTEKSAPGTDFLAQLCQAWEAAASEAENAARVVSIRTGIVLDPAGGSLKQMIPPFRFFFGGPLSDGQQWMSWIHIEDQVEALLFALNNSQIQGPLNLTAPEPIRNWGFSKALGDQLHRPSWFPVPEFLMRIALGEVTEVAVGSQRVYPARLSENGYSFRFTSLKNALANLLG